MDVLNAFNVKNYGSLFDGYPGLPYYYNNGDLAGVPRTVKLTMNVKF